MKIGKLELFAALGNGKLVTVPLIGGQGTNTGIVVGIRRENGCSGSCDIWLVTMFQHGIVCDFCVRTLD